MNEMISFLLINIVNRWYYRPIFSESATRAISKNFANESSIEKVLNAARCDRLSAPMYERMPVISIIRNAGTNNNYNFTINSSRCQDIIMKILDFSY